MKERYVSLINSSGERLVGYETFPDQTRKTYPAVILVHGFGEDKIEQGKFDVLAEKLSSAGFLVFRFDLSGCGESGGNYMNTSLSKLVSDLSAIWCYVLSEGYVDSKRIGILAQSFGTSVVIALGPPAAAAVLVGSIAHPKERLAEIFGEGYHPDGVSSRNKSNSRVTKVGPQFWADLGLYDLPAKIRGLQVPILFLHGAHDTKIPVSEMEILYKNAGGPKTKKVLDMDHGWLPDRELVYSAATAWLVKKIG